MAEYSKAALDACTDQAVMTFRDIIAPTLSPQQAGHGQAVAEILAAQFPGVPGLARIVLACAQNLCPVGASPEASAADAVCTLAAAGLALEEAEGDD